jgi:hypothetical protein
MMDFRFLLIMSILFSMQSDISSLRNRHGWEFCERVISLLLVLAAVAISINL